jgi:alpha-L-fucosidase 2
MLLQSQHGVIEILPALPASWPSGSVRGLRARGAATVSIAWSGGRARTLVLTADRVGELRLRSTLFDGPWSGRDLTAETRVRPSREDGIAVIRARAGHTYRFAADD